MSTELNIEPRTKQSKSIGKFCELPCYRKNMTFSRIGGPNVCDQVYSNGKYVVVWKR